MTSILDTLPAIVHGALGVAVFKAATITAHVRTSDGRGGREISASVPYECRALISDYSDFFKVSSGGAIQVRDRRAIVLGHGLSALPEIGFSFTQDGEDWSVIAVKRDPAGATYELQVRPV